MSIVVDFGPIQIKQFLKERDEALLSMDEAKITAHMKKWGSPVPRAEIFWLAVHKVRTGLKGIPMRERAASKQWLIAHGSESMDDGDIYMPSTGDNLQRYLDRCHDFGLKV